jgi:hypothetical protein
MPRGCHAFTLAISAPNLRGMRYPGLYIDDYIKESSYWTCMEGVPRMSLSQPEPFAYRSTLSDAAIPSEELSAADLGVEDKRRLDEYTRVPSELYPLFPPSSRLLLAVLFSRRVFGEEEPGGWVKLGQGLTRRFGLEDKDVRRRAVRALENVGAVEVKRKSGSCSLIRLRT